MRKVLLSIAVLASSVASAQLLNVGSATKVALPQGTEVAQVTLSHDGSFAVINSNNGLEKVSLATGKTTQIAKSASFAGVCLHSLKGRRAVRCVCPSEKLTCAGRAWR